MKRIYLILLACLTMLSVVQAQKLTVESVTLATGDLTASTQSRPDINGKPGALVFKWDSKVTFFACREDSLDIEYGIFGGITLFYSILQVIGGLDIFVVDTLYNKALWNAGILHLALVNFGNLNTIRDAEFFLLSISKGTE